MISARLLESSISNNRLPRIIAPAIIRGLIRYYYWNTQREPLVIIEKWQARLFFLPSLSMTQRGLCEGERGCPGGGALLGILGGGVPPGSPNLDPISTK